MQFPKELRHEVLVPLAAHAGASMKYSSRRNCDQAACHTATCSSRLNEVQFPKELRLGSDVGAELVEVASMKCSSRRNCDTTVEIAAHHIWKPQ